jgi:hypothetical protein
MTRAFVVLLVLSHGALHAQQQPLAGAWHITFPAGMRIEDGVTTPIMATGSLTVQPAGDSLIATLATDPGPDMPARPPLRLAAKSGSAETTFIGLSKATINMNGAEHEASVTSTWVLRAKGDSLSGTVARKIDSGEAGPQEPRPVTGVRKKG